MDNLEVLVRIGSKWQITVPPELRDLYDLREGDFFQVSANVNGAIFLPMRLQRHPILTAQDEREADAAFLAMQEGKGVNVESALKTGKEVPVRDP